MPSIKDNERILKSAREKQGKYKEALKRLAADLSTETLQSRREWQEIFQIMKQKSMEPRLLYPLKLSIKMEGKITIFPDKISLKEYILPKQHYKIY